MKGHIQTILSEIKSALQTVDPGAAERFISEITSAGRVYTSGSGRSGLIIKTFAIRLFHLGIPASSVGDTVTPPIRKGDLLIVASASGSGAALTGIIEKALAAGAKVFLITATADSAAAKLCSSVLTINAPAKDTADPAASIQPMGSMFEQSLLILLDSVVLCLMEKLDVSAHEMYDRHTNLE